MKKVLIAIFLLFLSLTIISITSSWAVFETNVDSSTDLKIAKWQILVNDYDINNTTEIFYVDNITYKDKDGNVVDTFAPGGVGEFILEINPNDTEVAFTYEIKIDLSNNNYEQIKLDNIEGIDGTVLDVSDGIYKRTVSLDDISNKKIDKIKVTFSWEFDDKYNESDSSLGLNHDSEFSFPINIKFSQYKG